MQAENRVRRSGDPLGINVDEFSDEHKKSKEKSCCRNENSQKPLLLEAGMIVTIHIRRSYFASVNPDSEKVRNRFQLAN